MIATAVTRARHPGATVDPVGGDRPSAVRGGAVAVGVAGAATQRRASADQGSGTLEERERRRRLAGRVRFRAGTIHGHRSSGRRTRWGRRPAPEPELTDEAWRVQGREAGRAELHRRVGDPALPHPALQPHGLAVGGVARPAALGRRAPVRRGRLRVGCAGRPALGRDSTSARVGRFARATRRSRRRVHGFNHKLRANTAPSSMRA